MSYCMVWLNGRFVGGWPYGYASFRLNLTPYAKPGGKNVPAVRLENAVPKDAKWQSASSRWYPGAGIYRNVWLVETAPVHVSQWGTYVTTPEISKAAARVDLKISLDNDSKQDAAISVATKIFGIDQNDRGVGKAVTSIAPMNLKITAGKNTVVGTNAAIANPKLWGTGLHQQPNRYMAETTVRQNGRTIDVYKTIFGIRTLKFDPNAGFFLNCEHIKLNGVCDHHDPGALGAAVNYRALQRQLGMLAEMGVKAIRTSHNPPAPELLDLADKMGSLIMDEAFDVWIQRKTELDYHLLFPEWHEQDLRAMLRRDRNHPSVILWSIGNEVGEQGVGICGRPAQYPVFHQSFPGKFIVGSETASTLSRGVYTFPVASGLGVPASAGAGEDVPNRQVSSYDLYSAPWSYSPDKEFAAQDRKAFNGLALVIVRAKTGQAGRIVVTAKSEGLEEAQTIVTAK